jgi:hypothetical protein
MNERFVPYYNDRFNDTIFHEEIAVKDELLENLI